MIETTHEPMETFTLIVFILLVAWAAITALAEWLRRIPLPPDPWDPEITRNLSDQSGVPVCTHCFAPQQHDRWFCPECGTVVGPYNNYMPYLQIFSEGEVLRSGVYRHVQRSPLVLIGYLVFSLFMFYGVFAPLYWFLLYVHWRENPPEDGPQPTE